MVLPLPTSLSPSKVASFKDCALAFRFSNIDRLPEPPSPAGHQGHAWSTGPWSCCSASRPPTAPCRRRLACLDRARAEFATDPEFVGLELDAEAEAQFAAEAEVLRPALLHPRRPRTVHPIGLELMLEAQVGSLKLRGIIDRLELDADGGLVVTDYKTGGVPPASSTSRAGWAASTSTPSCASRSWAGARRGSSCSTWPSRWPSWASRRPSPSGAWSSARRPSGRRWSGRAPTRTSGPARRACATGAPSRSTARLRGRPGPGSGAAGRAA